MDECEDWAGSGKRRGREEREEGRGRNGERRGGEGGRVRLVFKEK